MCVVHRCTCSTQLRATSATMQCCSTSTLNSTNCCQSPTDTAPRHKTSHRLLTTTSAQVFCLSASLHSLLYCSAVLYFTGLGLRPDPPPPKTVVAHLLLGLWLGRYGDQMSAMVIFGGGTGKGANVQHALLINAITILLV